MKRRFTTVLIVPVFFLGLISQVAGLDWQSDKSPVSFTAYVDFPNGAFNGWGKDMITQEITKRTGVTVDLTQATTNDSQQLNTMLATGDLPDFIIVDGSKPVRTTLWKQGFVYPLNQLMDKYAPQMRSIIPKDEDKVYVEDDGNLYFLTDYYADVDRVSKIPGAINTVGILSFNMPMYKELGSPFVRTLADYKNLLVKAKAKYPNLNFYCYDGAFDNPGDSIRNMAGIINRIYGGSDTRTIGADGTVHMSFRDPTYLQAARYINDLYRSKLFNPENFTVKTEQFTSFAKNQQIFSYWGQPFNIAKFDLKDSGPYKSVVPPQVPGIALKLKNTNAGIGGWHCVFISKNSKVPARAINYLEFLISDEGQILVYRGIEGKNYTVLPNGTFRNTPEQNVVSNDPAKGFPYMQTVQGILNYNITWLSSYWVDNLGYWDVENDTANGISVVYKGVYDNYKNFVVNERMNDLIMVKSDSNEKVIETKVFDLWKSSLPTIYLAESDAKCVAAYRDFIASAEKLGLKDLEKAYTASYQQWQAKLGK